MTASTASPAAATGPSFGARAAAVLVLIALAALAYYAVFSGPTQVNVSAPTQIAPKTAPAPVQREPEGEGGQKGD